MKKETKRDIVRDPDGLPIQVIRPDKPEVAERIAQECLKTNDRARFDDLPNEALRAGVEYTVMGFLARKKNGKGARIVDEQGNVIGPIAIGDSFITQHTQSN